MSTVSTSLFVNVIPQLIVAQGSGFELNGLVLVKDPSFPLGIPYRFTSQTVLEAYTGADSPLAIFGQKYFTANDNKVKIPPALLVCGYNLEPQAGWLRGAQIAYTLTQFKTITDGVLTVNIGGNAYFLTGLDFSGAESFTDIANVLQSKIQAASENPEVAGATVVYNPLLQAFTITAAGVTSASYVDYSIVNTDTGTDLAPILGLRQQDGAVISKVQTTAITQTQFMNNLIQQSKNWITFAKLWQQTDAAAEITENLGFSAWTHAQGVRYVYMEYDTNPVAKDPNSNADFASQLKAAGYAGTVPNFGDSGLAAFAMGTIAAINFDLTGGRITLAYKRQAGQPITVDNDDDYKTLAGDNAANFGKGYNVYVQDSAANDLFTAYQRGTISGPYQFADAYVNHVWFNDRVQVRLRNWIGNKNAAPFNESSYTEMLSVIKPDIDAALNADVINTEIDLDPDMVNAVIAETGVQDVASALLNQGWFYYCPPATSTQRANRGPVMPRIYYTDGGAIQRIDLYSTAIR